MSDDLSPKAHLRSLYRVVRFRPRFVAGIIGLSVVAALLEGIGLGFLVPVITFVESSTDPANANGVLSVFYNLYQFFGVPFTLESVMGGLMVVLTLRYSASFLASWFQEALANQYVRYLQAKAFERALSAKVSYFDKQGSDEILNTIVTQSKRASRIISQTKSLIQQGLLGVIYFGVAVYMAPLLTIISGVMLGILAVVSRQRFSSGYSLGDRVAEANESMQESVQAGMQGIRDVKLFGLEEEVYDEFKEAADEYVSASVRLGRNRSAIQSFYQLLLAANLFIILYVAIEFLALPIAKLGVFLFAMFRLSPRISNLNTTFYKLQGELPHLHRTQEFIEEIEEEKEASADAVPVPERIEEIEYDDVSFSYATTEQDQIALTDVTLTVERGETVAFVGPSGAGKSTLTSLLLRMYEPTSGEIRVNDVSIERFDIQEWRESVAVVQQNPYIFNDTLRYNVTVGKRDATRAEIERACEIARIDEFFDELPNGYDTILGDEGVRLSGGQRQRIAIARALLKESEVLILDEATSELDSNIEEQVHRAIESAYEDMTLLVIAHRLSTVVNSDRIYTLEDGEIVERGDHKELLSREGTYANLYSQQIEG